ncbi:hypothetical protein [Micromonospora zamorensis]|uniref:hypothetical protein n=1 Tax=Micromonospora zamorensis TaxID=709883 RepID=UPI0033AC9D3B
MLWLLWLLAVVGARVLVVVVVLAVVAVVAVVGARGALVLVVLAAIGSALPHIRGSSTGAGHTQGLPGKRQRSAAGSGARRSRCAADDAAGSRGQWQLPVPLSL